MVAPKKSPSGQVEPLSDGTTENKKIDWVLNNQTSIDERVTTMTASVFEMNARMATMETHNAYTTKSLDRIEILLTKQQEDIDQKFAKLVEMQEKQFDRHCQNQDKQFDRSLAAQEKAIDLQRGDLGKNTDTIVKLNNKFNYVAGAIAVVLVIGGLVIDGKITASNKAQQESQVKTKDTTK